MLIGKGEVIGVREQKTKEKGTALIISCLLGDEVHEVWCFDEVLKKKAAGKKKGQDIALTWKVRKFRGYMQIGDLVGVE